MTALYKDCIRDGTLQLLSQLNRNNVPVLVFSAGLGDSVISLMRQANVYFPNVKVVSNFLQFAENNIANGLQERLIHTFNKNEHALEGTDYYKHVQERDHVIVMGDSLGDATMADGVPAQSFVLKIGFLFDHVRQTKNTSQPSVNHLWFLQIEEQLDKYMDTFDIVLIDDQTMDVPNRIVSLIAEGEAAVEAA